MRSELIPFGIQGVGDERTHKHVADMIPFGIEEVGKARQDARTYCRTHSEVQRKSWHTAILSGLEEAERRILAGQQSPALSLKRYWEEYAKILATYTASIL